MTASSQFASTGEIYALSRYNPGSHWEKLRQITTFFSQESPLPGPNLNRAHPANKTEAFPIETAYSVPVQRPFRSLDAIVAQSKNSPFIIIIIIIIAAIALSLGGSSSYTSTDKTNKNKYT